MEEGISAIKVGGSLLDWPELPHHLAEFLSGRQVRVASGRLVLIAGGGPIVDVVRRLDRDHDLGDEIAHQLAIQAMDLTAGFLAAILPSARTIDRLAERFSVWDAGRIPILVPSPIVREIERSGAEPLPRSWDITSDSIAAWIACYLGARSLVLLKSAALPMGADRDTAARLERVDPQFPRISRGVPRVEYLNLRDPAGSLVTLE